MILSRMSNGNENNVQGKCFQGLRDSRDCPYNLLTTQEQHRETTRFVVYIFMTARICMDRGILSALYPRFSPRLHCRAWGAIEFTAVTCRNL